MTSFATLLQILKALFAGFRNAGAVVAFDAHRLEERSWVQSWQ